MKTNQILEKLRGGGLVISGRQTGKTTAIALLAKELADQQPIVVVANASMYDYFQKIYRERCRAVPPPPTILFQPASICGRNCPVLVDEWSQCRWAFEKVLPAATFLAATETNPVWGNMKVTVIK